MAFLKLKEVLENLEIEEILDTSFRDQIRLISWDLEDELFLFSSKKGFAWYIVKGGLISVRYFTGEEELFWKVNEGEWFGVPDAILNDSPEHDIKVLKGTVVLEIPLEKLLNSEETSKNFYRKMLKELARTVKPVIVNAAARIKYGNEMYFIEYLKRNNYEISFKSIKDLAVLLNISLRTFHRIIKRMVEENVLLKEENMIKVIDFEALDLYIQRFSKK